MASGSTREDVPVDDRREHVRWRGYQQTDDAGEHDRDVRSALRFGLGTAAVAVVSLVVAAAWASTCSGNTVDMLACGRPQLTLLAMVAPALLVGGGLWAFLRCYQSWRRNDWWWAWLGAGWFLLAVLLVVATTGTPSVTGAVIGL